MRSLQKKMSEFILRTLLTIFVILSFDCKTRLCFCNSIQSPHSFRTPISIVQHNVIAINFPQSPRRFSLSNTLHIATNPPKPPRWAAEEDVSYTGEDESPAEEDTERRRYLTRSVEMLCGMIFCETKSPQMRMILCATRSHDKGELLY